MLEALWSVDFQSNSQMWGTGVAVFETGRVLGGDSAMVYIGEFSVDPNGTVHAEIKVSRYSTVPMPSVVGMENFTLSVKGKADRKEMKLTGVVKEDPSRTITIHAVRRAELP